MARPTRTIVAWAVVVAVVVVVGVGGLLWWTTGSFAFAIRVSWRGLLIGLLVGGVTMVLGLGRPTASRLVAGTPWSARPYLVPGELPPPPTFFVGRKKLLAEVIGLLRSARPNRRRPSG